MPWGHEWHITLITYKIYKVIALVKIKVRVRKLPLVLCSKVAIATLLCRSTGWSLTTLRGVEKKEKMKQIEGHWEHASVVSTIPLLGNH